MRPLLDQVRPSAGGVAIETHFEGWVRAVHGDLSQPGPKAEISVVQVVRDGGVQAAGAVAQGQSELLEGFDGLALGVENQAQISSYSGVIPRLEGAAIVTNRLDLMIEGMAVRTGD